MGNSNIKKRCFTMPPESIYFDVYTCLIFCVGSLKFKYFIIYGQQVEFTLDVNTCLIEKYSVTNIVMTRRDEPTFFIYQIVVYVKLLSACSF